MPTQRAVLVLSSTSLNDYGVSGWQLQHRVIDRRSRVQIPTDVSWLRNVDVRIVVCAVSLCLRCVTWRG
eukprot:2539758-Prymnesium_polylepis.2